MNNPQLTSHKYFYNHQPDNKKTGDFPLWYQYYQWFFHCGSNCILLCGYESWSGTKNPH